eukprot:s1616_g4.t1
MIFSLAVGKPFKQIKRRHQANYTCSRHLPKEHCNFILKHYVRVCTLQGRKIADCLAICILIRSSGLRPRGMLGSTGVPGASSGGCASGSSAAGCGAGGCSTGSNSGNWEQLTQMTGIWHLPHRGVAVFRDAAAHAETFCGKLKEELQRYEFGAVRFENIDVSSVNWTEGHLSQLFHTLRMAGASSQRIKAFRCGAKDPSVLSLCEWLACTEASKIPQEIHLSHNELTTGSLEALITVLEVKSQRHRLSYPYWIRIEGNRMSPSFINDLAKDGKACLAVGKCSTRSCELMQQGQPLGAETKAKVWRHIVPKGI